MATSEVDSMELSPTSAALVLASQQVAEQTCEVLHGALRIRVVQVIDLPAEIAQSEGSSFVSWLRGSSSKSLHRAGASVHSNHRAVCIMLRIGARGGLWATETKLADSSVVWNEEFWIQNTTTDDELVLFCVDRARNEPHGALPSNDEVTKCAGFIGKVSIPLSRLLEGEESEQWYPLVPHESFMSLRTALRVAVCFYGQGRPRTRTRADSANTSTRFLRSASCDGGDSNASKSLALSAPLSPVSQAQSVPITMGIVDYVLVVGSNSSSMDVSILFRYPASDRAQFPLPTKIEWFCFPGGCSMVDQAQRPPSKLFSFVLVGGDDGLSRCYVLCFVFYYRAQGLSVDDGGAWIPKCICLLTRLPLLQEMTLCMLRLTKAWLTSESEFTDAPNIKVEYLLAKFCHGIPFPIRGVFGVDFDLCGTQLRLVVPSTTSIYGHVSHGSPSVSGRGSYNPRLSPSKSAGFPDLKHAFQPAVYSLETLFSVLDIKSIILLVSLILCEYRVLLHSTEFSLLCPVAESLCILIHPFHWQHPYVPILPHLLAEYLQAPLPYILGVHSSWIPDLFEHGKPEHLVLVDLDSGALHIEEDGIPTLPTVMTQSLYRRLKRVLHASQVQDDGIEDIGNTGLTSSSGCSIYTWSDQVELQIRAEFLCFFTTILMGYRDCLFFVNQKLPVFNKRRFFSGLSAAPEAAPFLKRLFCTQAFQSFLENHASPELNVFHSLYFVLARAKGPTWPDAIPWTNPAVNSGTTAPRSSDNSTPVLSFVSTEHATEISAARDDFIGKVGDVRSKISSLAEKIECQLDRSDQDLGSVHCNTEELDSATAKMLAIDLDYTKVAHCLGVDASDLEDYVDLFLHPHHANHSPMIQNSTGHIAALAAVAQNSFRNLSSEEEQIERILHKCLTAIFSSDEHLTVEDLKICEKKFKYQYARDLFVLILMQPTNQYIDSIGSNWYSPKGSGSCIGDLGFSALSKLAMALLDHCFTHQDFTNARGMLQVGAQYYRYINEKQDGIGFAKKEYLLSVLKSRNVCHLLDMWQHAFSRELEAALSAQSIHFEGGKAKEVSDELFFSVIGSLVYDMLSVEVPVSRVQSFVLVMCSTYDKEAELFETLSQLVENVHRALNLSKDISSKNADCASRASKLSVEQQLSSPGATGVSNEPRHYDLDNVIRRKMSVQDNPVGRKVYRVDEQISKEVPLTTSWMVTAPVCSMTVSQDKIACGLSDASVVLLHRNNAAKQVRLEGHADAVVALQFSGDTVISASHDCTIRVWNLLAATKKKMLFSFFTGSNTEMQNGGISNSDRVDAGIDSQCVMRKSLLLRGHTSRIYCLEIGKQVSTQKALFASGSADTTIRLWETDRDTSVAVLGNGKGAVRCLRFHFLYDYLISGGQEYTLKVWDLAVSKLRTNVLAHRGAIRDIQVSGDRLVTASNDRVVKVWDTRFRSGHSYSHALREHDGPVHCICVGGPADPNICTGSADGIVRVWDLRYSGKGPRLSLSGHTGQITCLQRDFTRLISGSEDGSLRVWDLHSGHCTKSVQAHSSGVTCSSLIESTCYSAAWDRSVRASNLEGGCTTSGQTRSS